jgi:CBS domain-containing protein
MKSVAEILRSKPDQTVYSVAPTVSVYDALRLMADKNIGALLVVEEGKIVGILSERDYARKVVLMDRSSKQTAVREVMTSTVMYARPDQTNEECMALMTDNRLRHLPVIDNGKLLGLVSIGDLVKDVISEQQFTIEQLQHYIQGHHRA